MTVPADSVQLLANLRCADPAQQERAAQQIFDRYFQRLWFVARKNLHPRIRQRIDPDDVVISGLGSVLVRMRNEATPNDCLSGLLIRTVVAKARQAARTHTAQKRNVFKEEMAPDSSADPVWDVLATADPSDQDAFWLKEAIEMLPPELQQVAVLKFQEKTDEEIAADLGYTSTEVIRIKKRLIESKWQDYFERS
jgi:RNA polymerase sigma-70 factor, ECF subfamily